MSVIIMITQLILGLALLVFVHEFGHFIAARAFKIRVPKFYLFFNPYRSIASCKRIDGKLRFKFFSKNLPDNEIERNKEGKPVVDEKGKPKYKLIDLDSLPEGDWRKYPDNTEYGIGWLPLGGYCQISGMIDETQTVENMPSEPQHWEYRSKPAWQRLIVVLAGIIVNLIVGVLLFAYVLGRYEKEYLPNAAITDGIYAYSAAREMGFQSGDKIISVNNKIPERFKDAIAANIYFGSIIQVEREGKQMDIVIGEDAYAILKEHRPFIDASNYPPIISSIIENGPAHLAGLQKDDRILFINDTLSVPSFGFFYENIRRFPDQQVAITFLRAEDTMRVELTPDSSGRIKIFSTPPPYQTTPYSLGQTFIYGWQDALSSLKLNIKGLGKVISGKENARESLSGPIGIAQLYGGVWNWQRFWFLTGLLSVILAFMNVLPVPGLDGGHAIFVIVELITGRKVSDKVLQYAQTVGMILLMLLMLFIIGNDIFKLFL
ncbi:MAG: RIP metalloprotease RseP [Bacteroidales bacterium]|jgi:regulator of sigma E protease|nr:RIP metalloprotease RseP [Bacteroidales bacterium]